MLHILPKRTMTMLLLALLGASLGADCSADDAKQGDTKPDDVVRRMPQLLAPQYHDEVLKKVRKKWKPEYAPMVLDLLPLTRDPKWKRELIRLLETKTGQRLGYDIDAWLNWLWKQEPKVHPLYADFKASLYGILDPKFRGYFSSERAIKIRLDEVRWGGVKQDGIPPLRSPKMIAASEADYLDDSNVIFGLTVGGDVRAYPKRILAWHEMFVDTVGGEPVTGVYCTLCGTMILYKSTVGDTVHQLGTSGFLYRSNKLMFDQATQSLWNTIWGQPVIGPLAEQDITLERLSVVTTTWGEWRKRHPKSLVLALDTGYNRDYSEGAAYKEYFSNDRLMFGIPDLDKRLPNKAEILGLIFARHPDQPLAISSRFLTTHPLYHDRVGEVRFVVLTDASGGHRVYETGEVVLHKWDRAFTAVDEDGITWTLSEDQLSADDGRALPRLPSHGAFWFGWYGSYTHTRLVDGAE